MKSKLQRLFFLPFLVLVTASAGFCAEGKGAAGTKPRPIPFHGTLASINPITKTFVVGKRSFLISPDTKFYCYKGDQKCPGSMADAVVGGPVTGSYLKGDGGKLLARSVYFKPADAVAGIRRTNGAPAAVSAGAGRRR